jgi:hypothetical protein
MMVRTDKFEDGEDESAQGQQRDEKENDSMRPAHV